MCSINLFVQFITNKENGLSNAIILTCLESSNKGCNSAIGRVIQSLHPLIHLIPQFLINYPPLTFLPPSFSPFILQIKYKTITRTCANSNDPAALQNLLGARPLLRLEADHPLKELLKLFSPEALLLTHLVDLVMELPKFLELLLHDEGVELVVLRCELKGQLAEHHGEENDSQSKDIAFDRVIVLAAILLASVYLRSHVALPGPLVLRKPDRLALVDHSAGQPKIADLDPVPLTLKPYQNILQLEVAVRHALGVNILHAPQNLPEYVPLLADFKLMSLQKLKQGSLLCILEDKDVIRARQLFIHFITLKGNILLVSKRFDHILMLQRFQKRVFVSQVTLLLPMLAAHHLQHHSVRLLPVGVQL